MTEEDVRCRLNDNQKINFVIPHKKPCCGCSLELPQNGNCNEYLLPKLLWRKRQNVV